MIWPPVKAWTSKVLIEDQRHFVAINYGGKLLDRWVVLVSVLDSSVAIKVPWSQLVDSTIWECGWDGNSKLYNSKEVNSKYEIITTKSKHLSVDSGLTIPITQNIIRPWFINS